MIFSHTNFGCRLIGHLHILVLFFRLSIFCRCVMESKTAHKRKPALEEKMRTIVVIMMEVGAHPQKHQQQQQQKKLVSGGNDSNDSHSSY